MTVQIWDDGEDDDLQHALDIYDDFAQDFGESDFQDARYGRVSTTTRPSIHYVNQAGIPDDVIDRHFRRGRGAREISSIIEKWSQSLNEGPANQTLDLFNRSHKISNAVHIHAQMARCAWAVESDDVLSTTADVLEALMWAKMRFELIDEDEQDIWNQWAGDVNMDSQLRKMGREELKCSQFYVGLWWAKKTYTVRDDRISDEIDEFERERKQREYDERTQARDALIAANADNPAFIPPPEIPKPPPPPGRGNRTRRKKFPLTMPTAMTVFDPTKVMPVGTLMFGRERLAYIATRSEDEAFTKAMSGEIADDTVLQLIERKYTPTSEDMAACAEIGVDYSRLWLFRKGACFRHTMTRADYERYAAVRLKPILPILEMKDHLRASDRATLIGNTNFIVVITKGTDKLPAKPAEIANLQQQAKVMARLPVLVGDHRLNVEIVSPPIDHTLQDSRWQVLDSRLVFKMLTTYAPVTQGGATGGGGTGLKEMARVIAKGLENRRHMILRTLEAEVFAQIMDRNEGVLNEFPNVQWAPKRITLDFSADVITQILKLRDRGDISRETMLEELDYDQDVEVLRRGKERVLYDRIFESSTPFSSPVANPFAPTAPQPPADPANPTQPAPQPPAPAPAKKAVAAPAKKAVAKKSNVGPKGQPRSEGGRPPGVAESQPRATRK